MARPPRFVIPDLPHHVYDRGNNRRRLFSVNSDRQWFVACLAAGLEASRCELHQLTLMSNHVHMIVTPRDEHGLAALMRRCKQRYAQFRNGVRAGSGSLFEARFKSKPISTESHLMAATLYNDANAYRAHLAPGGTEHEWSTGPLHAARPGSRIPADMWTPSGWYLGLGRSARERGRRYVEAMSSYLCTAPEPPEAWAIRLADERHDTESYRRRVERPDGSNARECASTQYAKKVL